MYFQRMSVVAALAVGALAKPADMAYPNLARRDSGDNSLTLESNLVQSGSTQDGLSGIGGDENAQAPSLTSNNNFINNCAGKTLTNGLQITSGSCNGIPMGDIPAKTNMVSSIITFPHHNQDDILSDQDFNITVQMSGLVAGSFTNADATYYAAPQTLQDGFIVGHTHVTVQDMGNDLNPQSALDPTQFAFFKGINDAGNGQGLLTAVVSGGLPAGNYRVCTMASASNHQPVLMPVAQRGTSDDCTKFSVRNSGNNTINVAANDGSKGEAAASLAAAAVSSVAVNGEAVATTSFVPASTTSTVSPPFPTTSSNSGGSGSSSGSGSSGSGDHHHHHHHFFPRAEPRERFIHRAFIA